MVSKNNKIPDLRFPEFTEGLKEMAVLDFAPLQRGFDLPVNDIVTGPYPVVFSNGILKTHHEFRAKAPGVVTGRSGTIGKVTYVKEDYWPHNTALWVTSFKGNDPKFVYYFYLKFDLLRFATGSGVPTLNRNDVHSQTVYVPSNAEQQKIASFLSAVDEKIGQLSRKKKLLTKYKKGVMQQIFNQKIRFKGDQGKNFQDWQERKLSSVIARFMVPMRDKPADLKGTIPWCRIEDFDGKYLYRSKSNQGVSHETVTNLRLKVYPVDTLLVSCSANLGFCAITKAELVTNQTFIGLVPINSEVSVEFLYYVMKFASHRLNVLSSGTTISYLSREEFENFRISVPSLREQERIADFLTTIDKKIDLVNTQLEKTKTFKKGLLQQMFV